MLKKILLLSSLGTFLSTIEGSGLMAMEQADPHKGLSRQERIAAMKIKRKAALSQNKNSSDSLGHKEGEKEQDIPPPPLPPAVFEGEESGEKEIPQEPSFAQLLQNRMKSLKKVEPTESHAPSTKNVEDNPLAGAFNKIDSVKESSSENDSDEEWGDDEATRYNDFENYEAPPLPSPPPSPEKIPPFQNHEIQHTTQQPPSAEPPFDPSSSIRARREALHMSMSGSDELPVAKKKGMEEDDDLFTVEGD